MDNKTINISIGDPRLFELAIGRRRTKKELLSLPIGKIPIISARLDRPFGYISSDSYVCSEDKLVLWNIDSSRWDTRVIEGNYKFIPTDHCGYMRVISPHIMPEYIAYKLYECGLHIGFKHEYRASLANIKEISFAIPVDEKGNYDIAKQKALADKYRQCIKVRKELFSIIGDLTDKHININSSSNFVRVSIGDFMVFKKGSAKYTEKYCKEHKGAYPVYSAGTKDKTTIGHIHSFDYEKECLKITTNGHYAGTVEYLPESKFSINGDAGILFLKHPSDIHLVDYRYIEYALQNAREQYGFNWNNKPLENDIIGIEIMMPVRNGKWDITEQQRISSRFVEYRNSFSKLQACIDGLDKLFVKVD